MSWHARVLVAALARALPLAPAPARAATTSATCRRSTSGAVRPHVTMIGDSSLAGVRWVNAYGDMKGGYDLSFDAESCRRTDYQGCMGREGYAPRAAVEGLTIHRGNLSPYVVAMVGYNDGADMFRSGIDHFMEEALRQGVRRCSG